MSPKFLFFIYEHIGLNMSLKRQKSQSSKAHEIKNVGYEQRP